MTEESKHHSLRAVLLKATESNERLRFIGAAMAIIAEGMVAYVGDDIVAIKHQEKEDPVEFLRLDCILKVVILAEYGHY